MVPVSVCGARQNLRAYAFPRFCRPLHLPPAAQGGLGQTLTDRSSPTGTKNKSHSECIIHYGIYWHILRYWMQRNADEHPQILLKSCFLGVLFSCAVILKYAFCYPMIDFGGKVNGIRKEYSVAV